MTTTGVVERGLRAGTLELGAEVQACSLEAGTPGGRQSSGKDRGAQLCGQLRSQASGRDERPGCRVPLGMFWGPIHISPRPGFFPPAWFLR